ncbi:zinc finger protein 184-like [Centruroides sculpturatus]|uniref:zinc finger protein 184-like n=1 Tax=Centruroides sculpturatus TaxID=218467 RepID=UPI000C6EB6B7|nr:zinc finger protein 184-like [Centruroides sculpturatus]
MKSNEDEEKIYQCNTCGKRFKYKHILENHIRIHTGERPFVCNICGIRFSNSGILINHKRVHSEGQKFKCNYPNCTFDTKYKSNLLRHVKETHSQGKSSQKQSKDTKERKYRCNTCPKSFILPSALKQHMLSHSNEKQYSCDICKMKFRYKYSLNRHKKRQHIQQETGSISKNSIQHAEQVQAESFQTPSTSAQATGLIELEAVASRETIFTPREVEEFLEHFNIDSEFMQMETSSQMELISEILDVINPYDNIHHAEQVKAESLQTPSTSAQSTGLTGLEAVAPRETIFTPREAEEFLEHFNIDSEIMQMEPSSQMELFSQIETEENKFECQFCKEQFSDEISVKEHERNIHYFN